MKLICLFMFAVLVQVSASSYSQNTKLNVTGQNLTLEKVFELIEDQSEFSFIYNLKQIDLSQKVDVDFKNEQIEKILDQVLEGTKITYTVNNRLIVVHREGKSELLETPVLQQQKSISGSVTDDAGEPLPGVTIIIKGTSTGTVTDMDGNYSIPNVPENATLVFSFVGMRTQEIVVTNQQTINVTMIGDAIGLDEVVAIGYGTQKKVNLTGAVAVVKMDEVLGDRPVTSLGAILQGSVPGFTSSSSVVPGGGNSFNIRGLESINGGAPLVLVDNVVFNNLSLINPEDIESVSVLKDASSAAIYGARASFGVILITTKKGKRNNQLSINYNNSFAISKVDNLPELAPPTEMIQTLQDGGYSSIWSGQNMEVYGNLLQDYNNNPSAYPLGWTEDNGTKYFLRENDLMGDMFESSWKQTHNISVQGGSESINYRISMGYTDENGILVTDKDAFTRTNVSSYVNGDITPWLTSSLDIKYMKGDKTYPYTDGSSELRIWRSNLPSYHPDSLLPYGTDGTEYPVMTPANVIELTDVSSSVTDNTRVFSRTEIKPLEGLKAIFEYSYQLSSTDYESYANYFQVHQGLAESIKPSTATDPFTTYRSSTRYSTINAYTNYDKTVGEKHNISAVAGYNQEYSDYRYLYAQAYNMISNELPSLSGTNGATPSATNDDYNEYALRSGFFRANYNYAQKYFVEFNGRYDLSSKFPKDYRTGFFPSVSAAWNIAKESFMKDAEKTVSLLKLRASYGTLGNQSIGNYGFLPTLPVIDGHWINNGILPQTIGNLAMVRANYTWESVNTINGGIDFGFLNNKLSGSFDIFQRNTIGMLGPGEEFPAVAGATAPNQNAADLKTNGWEFAINYKGNIGEVKYGLGFNIYDSRSEITRYKNETKLLSAPYYVGQEIGEIWGYVTDGFYTESDFDETGALKEDVVHINGVTSHVGDIKYKNLSDNESSTNIINTGDNTADDPGDRTIIGNSRPHYQYGFNGNAKWDGFGFSFILQGVGKRDAWIGGNIIFPMSNQYGTVYDDQVGKIWTPENTQNAYYGRIYENAGSSQGSNQRVSDKFLSDASYLRVKNITLSYNLPKSVLQKMHLKNLKLFISGENLFTFDHLPSGIDPESLGWNYPHYRTISFGINLNL
ncbi:TonB-dependent receptor [Prolixibacteraceae bacterium Z1-6]|uniref:TonB-dependent receptor n=1 Tax=Draconibacterium aestuarii TaxID=2998507 RepID=A0A9X3FA81_9BACT|nr:TonB-dependent receptor [Prolixibacteraceae bacterium Z1-6]